jgi:hypothetical protein
MVYVSGISGPGTGINLSCAAWNTDDRHKGQRGFAENLKEAPQMQEPAMCSTMNIYFRMSRIS